MCHHIVDSRLGQFLSACLMMPFRHRPNALDERLLINKQKYGCKLRDDNLWLQHITAVDEDNITGYGFAGHKVAVWASFFSFSA